MKNSCLGLCLLLVTLMAAQPSGADLITFQIGGRFTEVEGLGLSVGHRFSVTYTFDSAQTDALPQPGGDYLLTSYRLVVPALGLDVTGTGSFNVNNDVLGGLYDQYAVALDIFPPILINDIVLFDVQISLIDVTATVFSDESIPLTPPALSSFPDSPSIGNARSFELRGSSVTNCAIVVCNNSGTIDRFALVPAPSTPAALLAGLAALVALQLSWFRSRRPSRAARDALPGR